MGDHLRLEGQLEIQQLEDGHGVWDCLVTDGCSLQTGRPVGDQGWEITSDWKADWSINSWKTDTEVGTVLSRMGVHFRLEGQLGIKQLEEGHRGWDCLVSGGRSLQTGRPIGV